MTSLIIFRAHMKVIIKVKTLVLIRWSYRSLSIMLTTEPGMVIIFWAQNPISFFDIRLFGSHTWSHTKAHIAHIYRCPDKKSNHILCLLVNARTYIVKRLFGVGHESAN